MEGLTRLVSESLARHGFDRPLDYRRLRWSQWFRCDSHHSLLFVPSKPGVFALAEEVMDFGPERSSAEVVWDRVSDPVMPSEVRLNADTAATPRRMLAVTQFFEDEDMAFVLDRMVSRPNSMNARLTSGRYFARFVVIEDETQRRSICSALNQWIASAAEKATGIGSHFASSLELTPATEYIPQPDDRQSSLFAVATDTHVVADAFVRPERGSAEAVWDRVSACPEPSPRDPVEPTETRQDFAGATALQKQAEGRDSKPGERQSSREGSDSNREDVDLKREGADWNREGHDFSRAEKASQIFPAFAAEGLATRKQAANPLAPQLNSGAATNIHCPSPFPSGF